MSQSRQTSSTPTAPGSTVKPTKYETGAASASAAGTAAKPAASAGAASAGNPPKTNPPSSTPPTSSVTTIGASSGSKSTTVPSSKPEPPKATSTGLTKLTPATNISASTSTKVQSEVAGKTSAHVPFDPLDALADTLPSSNPVESRTSMFTGPEIREPKLISAEANPCGVRDDTLPPGYRKQDLEKNVPAGPPEKPKEVSKPLTLDEAVDSLSSGFTSSGAKHEMKTETVAAASAGKNFAPAPPDQKKQTASVPASVAPSAPADKKPKTDPTHSAQTVKPKAVDASKVSAGVAPKSKDVPKVDDMALDALDALGDTLPTAKEVPKPPEPNPKDLVKEANVTSKKGVRVGEREDTLPPDYRFKEDKNAKHPPPPPKEPSMDTTEALDILSGGFIDSCAAPAVHAPPPPSGKQQPKVDDMSALDALADDFVAPAQCKQKQQSAPPADKRSTIEKVDDMALDALDALGDTLPTAKEVPKTPEPNPKDLVKEASVTSEKGVRVGEREDTLPPGYRFTEDKNAKHPPPPPKEPSMDTTEALDILSGGFIDSCAAPAVHAPPPPSSKQQPKVDDMSALDALADDFVAPAQCKQVSAGPPSAPTAAEQGEDMSLDALDALGDLLPDAKVPESPKLRPEDIIDEKPQISEKGVRVGEREDTLPPGYRFSEKDQKNLPPPPKKEPSLDPAAALDMLSDDFETPSVCPAVKASVPPSAPPAASCDDFSLEELAGDFVAPKSASKVQSAASIPPKADRQLSEGTSSAMDALSDTLKDIGGAPEPVPVSPKDIVKEKEAVEERIKKAGERDDSLPPEYRPTKADIKAAAKAKADIPPKQPSLDDLKALDILSSGFSDPTPTAAACQSKAPTSKTSSTSKAQSHVMDDLASSLLPESINKKSIESKPKKLAEAEVPPAGKPSTDMMSTTTTKTGGKS